MAEPPPPLAAAIAASLAEGRAAWPAVVLDADVFARHAARVVASAEDPAAALAAARSADLFLAAACLAGDATAVRAFEEMLRVESRRAAAELRAEPSLADEIHSALRSRMLLPDTEDALPRLASFAGQSSLGRWLGVAATRLALNLLRQRARETPLDSSSDGARVIDLVDDDPELDAIRRRYADDLRASVREAFAAIDTPRDRNLLRLYYYDRLGLDRLGEMYGVNASTVSRWLASLRQRVRDDTRRRLSERLGARDSEIESLVRLLGADLDLTLSRILAP
jgi:RNA polymerase sigma-70 factor (ECF subfamily)